MKSTKIDSFKKKINTIYKFLATVKERKGKNKRERDTERRQ